MVLRYCEQCAFITNGISEAALYPHYKDVLLQIADAILTKGTSRIGQLFEMHEIRNAFDPILEYLGGYEEHLVDLYKHCKAKDAEKSN